MRNVGRGLEDATVGVVGCGRIGSRVIEALRFLGCKNILINDLVESRCEYLGEGVIACSLKQLLAESDAVTFHVSGGEHSRKLIRAEQLNCMRSDAVIVNTSRGDVFSEPDLVEWLYSNPEATAFLDVFEEEPYSGPLVAAPNAFLTAHMGSMTQNSRVLMELGAVENIGKFLAGRHFDSPFDEFI